MACAFCSTILSSNSTLSRERTLLLTGITVTAYEFLDHRRAIGPAQDMGFLLQQHLFGDQPTLSLEPIPLKDRTGQLTSYLLKALTGRDETEIHLALGQECLQIIQPQQARRDIRDPPWNGVCGDDLVLQEPEYINTTDILLEDRIRSYRQRRETQIAQALLLPELVV